jgi:hypothetical protein
MIARILSFFGVRVVDLDMVHVPVDKWHSILGERDRLRLEVERLRALVRGGV